MRVLHKKEHQKKNSDQLIRLLMPMIAGVLACVFCLVSMTWAWFTASVHTPTQTIQSAMRSTAVIVYEVRQSGEEKEKTTKTFIKPETAETVALTEHAQVAEGDASVVVAGEELVWKLSPEKSYEVVMTGGGTASTGYCEVALSYAVSGSGVAETELYKTAAFEKDNTVTFTYNTGGFLDAEGVTETQYKAYVENAVPPTLSIASHWGAPTEEETTQVSLMSARNTEKVMLLSNGDVVGLAPIPCPEAKAETEIVLEGFEAREGAVVSAEEDYKISLTLKEGYEMPSEVVVNIGGKDYVVSTGGAVISDEAPYYDASTGILTVPSALLSDGITVSVKATATQVPAEEETEEEKTEEEATEETEEETVEETEEAAEETTDNIKTEEEPAADTTENSAVTDNPAKKEDDEEGELSVKPVKTPSGSGGKGDDNDGDDDKEDNNSGDSSVGDTSSPDNNEEETEVEKADVTLNLSQLTINLEETKIPTNADLVFTLSAKEDMELPEKIAITLDKTIRDENTAEEEIQEDKTEYIIYTDGQDNPEGFEFDAETGELTIASELLKGVREITIADIEQSEATEEEEKAEISFEVKNLAFDFTDDEIVTDEDVVITFTAGEDYELPETIVITIDGEEYIVFTSAEDGDKNPDGITFDIETGTLTISKDLLEDVKAIAITAEGIKKEEDASEEENPGADSEGEPADPETDNKENEDEGGEVTGKDPENDEDESGDEDNTETEGDPDAPGGENDETTGTEPDSDDTTDDEDTGKGNPTDPDTEPETGDNADGTGDGESGETGENGGGEVGTGTEEDTNPSTDTEGDNDGEVTPPAETTTPAKPSEPAEVPGSPKTDETETSKSVTDENDGGTEENASGESAIVGALSTSTQASGNPSDLAVWDKSLQGNVDSLPPENYKLEQ